MAGLKVLIIIPAYNEEENMPQTLAGINSALPQGDILVIDDGSSDNTSQVSRQAGADVLTLPFNLGIGSAVQTGFMYAYNKKYDIVVRLDADGQHDPDFICKLLDKVWGDGADIAIGSRFIGQLSDFRSSLVRRLGILFFAQLISFLTRIKVTDPTSGFAAFGKKAIDLFSVEYPNDFPEPESIVVAYKHGLNVVEVPVKMRKRAMGRSSIRYLRTLYYMVKVTFAIFLDMIKKTNERGLNR